MTDPIQKAIEALNEYFETASGHSCKQCSAPTDEMLSSAIKSLLALQTSRPDAGEIAEAYKYNENDILDAQMIARSAYTMDERGRAEASLKHLYVIRAALQSGDKVRWMPIESAPRDGTEILVACMYNSDPAKVNVCCNARWIDHDRAGEMWHDIEGVMGQEDVTHWAKIPAPPTSEGV